MIRFGVIGTNVITEKWIEDARKLDEFILSAVYSRTEEKAAAFSAKFNIPHTYIDLQKMVRSSEIDAVYIASPNSFHAKQAILCMNHGKHVLCEKPVASNSIEFQSMSAAAKHNDVLLMEALKTTLLPNFQAILDNLPKLGRIRRYFASYCKYSSRYDAYKQGALPNAFNPVFSNGSLMDLGIYCIYPLVVLFGKPDTLKASGVMLDSGIDGEGSLLLKYNGMDAIIMHSKITDSHTPAEIQGENGTMIIDRISQPTKVEIRYRNGTVEDISRPQLHHTMLYEMQEFIQLLKFRKRESEMNSHANSIAAMKIMDEARRQIGLVFAADTI